MKPFRGKRTELGEFAVVIQPARLGVTVHLAAAERSDRLSGRRKLGGKVATRSRVVLQAAAALADLAGEERLRCTPLAGAARAVGSGTSAANCSQFVVCARLLSRSAVPRAPRVRASWFLALRPTRLETRTKELSTRASRWASRTPVAQLRQNGRDPALACRRNAGPQSTRCE